MSSVLRPHDCRILRFPWYGSYKKYCRIKLKCEPDARYAEITSTSPHQKLSLNVHVISCSRHAMSERSLWFRIIGLNQHCLLLFLCHRYCTNVKASPLPMKWLANESDHHCQMRILTQRSAARTVRWTVESPRIIYSSPVTWGDPQLSACRSSLAGSPAILALLPTWPSPARSRLQPAVLPVNTDRGNFIPT